MYVAGQYRRPMEKSPQPPHSAEARRPGPNEDWTLIIRRIWLPHETSHTHLGDHTHTYKHTCTQREIRFWPDTYTHAGFTDTHTDTRFLTSQGFRCHPVLCRLYTQSSCRQLWVFSAMQTDAVDVPVAVVPMETWLIKIETCTGTCRRPGC